jgi:anhydro-N-acetylmuramic acid kinase
MTKTMRAIGLMSGTSMDGIDVALIETDGKNAVARGPCATFPYDTAFRALLVRAAADAAGLDDRTARPGCLAEVERDLTGRHAAAVAEFMRTKNIPADSVDVIGFHGHTVLHEPHRLRTVQIGDGRALAQRTGIDVVYDLRANDVESGGQGAPLAPVYHRALAAKLEDRSVAIVNIGGVANVTWIGGDGTLIAFDTGPGNALLDDWVAARTAQAFDESGKLAAAGRVDESILKELLRNPYFGRPPPKSLDRDAFSSAPASHLSAADGAATLAAFTAAAIARARAHFPEEPRLWVICGGGRRNRTLMSMVAADVESAVIPAEAAGLNGDAVEAEAWAYLAVRSLKGWPITFPGTTGVPRPMPGGVLARK